MLAVLVVDQWSKHWALERLYPLETIDLIGSLQFNLHFNTGMAFSGFATGAGAPSALAIVIAVVLVLVAPVITSMLQLVLIGIVIGGALGNVIDRVAGRRGQRQAHGTVAEGFMSGAVVDFIDVQWWPCSTWPMRRSSSVASPSRSRASAPPTRSRRRTRSSTRPGRRTGSRSVARPGARPGASADDAAEGDGATGSPDERPWRHVGATIDETIPARGTASGSTASWRC